MSPEGGGGGGGGGGAVFDVFTKHILEKKKENNVKKNCETDILF